MGKSTLTTQQRTGVKKMQKAKGTSIFNASHGLKFAPETYETVSRFTKGTRIKYGPNPKTLGSKSYDRYAKYMKAKTVGEALQLGSKPADLLWEYERGMYRVIGGPYSEDGNLCGWKGSRGFSLKIDSAKRQRCKKIANECGINIEELYAESEKCASAESADVLVCRSLANSWAGKKIAEAEKAGRKIRESEVLECLQAWGFGENTGRLNVMPEGTTFVHSDTIGLNRMMTSAKVFITSPTTAYPNFTKLLTRFLSDSAPDDLKLPVPFVFTGINVNANYAGKRHRDANNEGPSAIKALGKFSGGKLSYWPKDRQMPRPQVETLKDADSITLDLKPKFTLFDGNCAHGVQKFKGERFSLVYFTMRSFHRSKLEDRKRLEKLGFRLPTKNVMKLLKEKSLKLDKGRSK